MGHLSGNQVAWLFIGIPAVIAWLGAGLGWLLAPHLLTDPAPLLWAMYAAGGWYGLLIVVFGGWMGGLLLGSIM
jgi:hypothetical protein